MKYLRLSPKLKKYLLSALIPLAISTGLFFIVKGPITHVFEYNVDEGIKSMTSLLMLKGFSLYSKIYSDQPPLFTAILAWWFKLFGPSIYHGRILILIFSFIFLWAFYQTIKHAWGQFCGFTAVIFLLLSSLYLRLGISIMRGTVSLSLAILSIYCITLYKKSCSKYLLVLSGVFFALSLQAKLITAFLIPLIVFEIIQAEWINLGDKKLRRFLPSLLLWSGSLLAVSLVFFAIFFHFNFPLVIQRLIQPHLRKLTVPNCDFFLIWQLILSDYDIALLALMGIILLIRQKKWQFLFPALWTGTALAALTIYKPIWEHYYTIVSIPICWLAAISFSQFFAGMRNKKNFSYWLTAAIIILTILKMPGKYSRMLESIHVETPPEKHEIVDLLLKYKKDIRWIFTDRPIFAFYVHILVPPELALIEKKRDFINKTDQTYLIDKLEEYKPEVILLTKLKYLAPTAIAYIKNNYTLLYKLTPHYHYVDETNAPPIEKELFMKLTNYFLNLKEHFNQIEFFRPKPDYKYFYRLLTKDQQFEAAYFLAGSLDGSIASESANSILPFTQSENGKFRLKSYDEVAKKWTENFPDQSVSFFAYQYFKKVFKIWEGEQGKSAVSVSTISRLKSLRGTILSDMERGEVIHSFNPRRNPPTFYEKRSYEIVFYIRKDTIKPADSILR